MTPEDLDVLEALAAAGYLEEFWDPWSMASWDEGEAGMWRLAPYTSRDNAELIAALDPATVQQLIAAARLGAAWQAAEAALPEDGQHLTFVRHTQADYCVTATVEPFTDEGLERGYDVVEGDGESFAAALLSLAEALRGRK